MEIDFDNNIITTLEDVAMFLSDIGEDIADYSEEQIRHMIENGF